MYHNDNGLAYSDCGRMLSITAVGDNYEWDCSRIYNHIDDICFENKQYRRNIGAIKKSL